MSSRNSKSLANRDSGAPTALTIASLGDFQLWRGTVPVDERDWPTQKSKSLFKILLSAQGELVTAEQLIEWLWPDLPPEKARNSLWVAVSQARRVLEPELGRRTPSAFIVSEGEGYRFDTGSDQLWDVDAYRAAVARARQSSGAVYLAALEEAQARYNGDYLAEDAYAEWALPLRRELRQTQLEVLLALAEAQATAGQYDEAVAQAQAALGVDAAEERAYAALMRYAYFLGDQRLALRTYDVCVQQLRAELDVAPSAATADLYRQIQRRTLARPVVAAPLSSSSETIYTLSNTPLVGRALEMAQLAAAVHGAIGGQGRVVLIEGEPGIGKSRLVQEAMRYAQEQGMTSLTAFCYQAEQAIPYQPVVDMLDQVLGEMPANRFLALPPIYLAELATLSPELRELAGDLPEPADDISTRQARRLRALQQTLETLGGDGGLFLTVDDVHWADHATWQFLHHLASHIEGLPLLLVCTYRPDEVAADETLATFIDSILRTPNTTRLSLARLTQEDTARFIQQLMGEADHTLGMWLHTETEGNPFFLVSILQSLVEQQLLSEDRPVWQVDRQRLDTSDASLALPDALRESVRARLRHTPQAMRRVLDVAAVVGRRFDFATLQAVTGEDGLQLLEMVEGLLERQLLAEAGDGMTYDFSHDKVREVVYADLSGARRVMLHRMVAEALERTAGGGREWAAVLARHFEAGQVWDKAAANLIVGADRSRELFALREATQFYDRALALAAAHPGVVEAATVIDVTMYRGLTLALMGGRIADAVADLHGALDAAEAAEDLARRRETLIALGQVYRMADDLEHANTYLSAALALCREHGDRQRLADVLHHLGTVAWSAGDITRSFLYHKEAAQLLENSDQVSVVTVQALHGLGEALTAMAQPIPACEAFEASLQQARRIGNKRYEGENLQMIGWATIGLSGTADYARAQTALEAGLQISLEAHLDWNSGITRAFLGWVTACRGDYRAGLALIQNSIEQIEADGLARFLSMAYSFLGYVYQDLNLHEAALEAHARACETALQANVGFWLVRQTADVAIARMRLGELAAVSDLEVAYATAQEGFQRWHVVRCLEGLMEAAWRQESPAQTLYYADKLEQICAAGSLQELAAQGMRWRGLAYLQLGELDAAVAVLERALALALAIERPRLHWDVYAALSQVHTARGDWAEAAADGAAVAAIVERIAAGLAYDGTLCAGLPLDEIAGLAAAAGRA